MWFSPLFLFVSVSIAACFGLSRAADCALNDSNKPKVAYTITVDISGHGNFTKIQDAIDSVPSNNARWIHIYVMPGTYAEQVVVPVDKPCILIEGDSKGKGVYGSMTTIQWNGHEAMDKSATFTTSADNFIAKRVTFKNTYNLVKGPDVKPAVAVEVFGDKTAFYECSFYGLQDTLWDQQGRHYFKSCYIQGAVDFIFGNGQSIYEGCDINVTAGKVALGNDLQGGYITAQNRNSADEPTGYVFNNSNVFGSGQTYLGRAYGPYSRVIFINSSFSQVVNPEGWSAWGNVGHENDFTYAEFNCSGPGSDTSGRVKWEKNLTSSELEKFSIKNFINQEGWIANQP